jgi:hypothetical protein
LAEREETEREIYIRGSILMVLMVVREGTADNFEENDGWKK